MTDRNLEQWLDEDGLTLPKVRSRAFPEGKSYHVDSPDYETGIRLQRVADLGAKVAAGGDVSEDDAARLKLDDREEREFSALVLGATLDEMREDGVSWGTIRRAVKYVFAFYTLGEESAQRMIDPKAPATPNRAERRANKKSSGKAK